MWNGVILLELMAGGGIGGTLPVDLAYLEGYRPLTFMILDRNTVPVSPASVWPVLRHAGRPSRWNLKPSKKEPTNYLRAIGESGTIWGWRSPAGAAGRPSATWRSSWSCYAAATRQILAQSRKMSDRTIWLASLRKREPDFVRRTESLEPRVGRECVDDILRKTNAILSVIPNARLSLIDTDFTLIAVSRSHEDPFFPNGVPQGKPCYEAYNRFTARCSWCTAADCMTFGRVTTTSDVVSPSRFDVGPNPDLVVSDIIAIPCGRKVGSGASHCLELVFNVTKREQDRAELQFLAHQFIRLIFERVRESASETTLHHLLLFGCLKATAARSSRWHLMPVEDAWAEQPTVSGPLTICPTDRASLFWDEFLQHGHEMTLSQIGAKIADLAGGRSEKERWPGMTPDRWQNVRNGKAERYDRCRKAVVFVPGSASDQIRAFLLVIDKTETPDFVTVKDMVSLSEYATFCTQVLATRRVYRERERFALQVNRLGDLSQGPLRDAYAASMIISAAHTSAAAWRNDKDLILSLIDYVPLHIAKKPAIRRTIAQINSSAEVLSNYFRRVDRWRALGKVDRRSVRLYECVTRVLPRFEARSDQLGFTIGLECPERNIAALADESYVEEIVMNLLQNSFDAIEGRSMPSINVLLSLVNNMAEIRVVDNGDGFLDSEKNLLWVPGYTTKPNGTGFGLAFVKYAAEGAFKGTVDCYSVRRSRTGFVVRIPVAYGGR